jgi:uncharacterized membrane protein YdjX (TVP38/TMEM64 family)
VDLAQAQHARRRFAYFLTFIAATALTTFLVLRGMTLTPESLRAAVESWGALAPLAYVAVVAMRPFLLFPTWLLFIAAGLVFGPWLGTMYAAIGGTAAALLAFGVARWLGRDFVQARLPQRLHRLRDYEIGTGLIFFLNLVPIMPFTAVCYGAGLSRVPLRHYTLGVVAGLTPRAFAYTLFGNSLLDVGSPQFLAAVGLLILMVIVPLSLRWYLSRRPPRAV